MLASMSEIDPRVDTSLVDWSEVGVSGLLPTGTVTLLLADVEGSTRLWETQSGEMTAAIVRLNQAVSDIIATHGGVRPVEQGEGDSFVAAFARASDAVAAALELQRAPLAPIRLRIGVHIGEVQLRDEGNYAGPTINRTARLRDLGHGGQTLLSGATEQLVVDRLPTDAWLTELGIHPLRDLPRPERLVQLCLALVHRQTAAEHDRGLKLLAELSDVFLRRRHNLSELPGVNVYLARERARRGDRVDAIPLMRAAVDHLFREEPLLAWGVCATGVLVETLLDRGAEGDVAEAEAAIERLARLRADGFVPRDIWLLRLRALLARAHGDAAAYADFRNRYRDMARSLGFEGHITWAEAMA